MGSDSQYSGLPVRIWLTRRLAGAALDMIQTIKTRIRESDYLKLFISANDRSITQIKYYFGTFSHEGRLKITLMFIKNMITDCS